MRHVTTLQCHDHQNNKYNDDNDMSPKRIDASQMLQLMEHSDSNRLKRERERGRERGREGPPKG